MAQNLGEANKGRRVSQPEIEIDDTPDKSTIFNADNRIVNLSILGEELQCTSCETILSLNDIVKETIRGLGSILSVRCKHCLYVKTIHTSRLVKHSEGGKQDTFEINYRIATGCIHAGIENQGLNKLLASAGIPTMHYNTYKDYENRVGPVVEMIAKESCDKAVKIERELTIKNVEDIEKMVPLGHRENFIIPDRRLLSDKELGKETNTSQEATGNEKKKGEDVGASQAFTEFRSDESSPRVDNISSRQPKKLSARSKGSLLPVASAMRNFTVRLMLSFDCAWSKRGNGKDSDSLNSYAALIGTQSGLIVDYATANRVCRKCQQGHPKDDHECHQHFSGSAKAIEAHLALKLATESKILKNNDVQLGIFCSDEDSTAIAGVRGALAKSHYVVKLSDRNHLREGVRNLLYSIPKARDPDGEINKHVIDYLERGFSYAMAQNAGDEKGLASALRAIPLHAFNNHSQCSDWCGYKNNPEEYSHPTIGEGIHSPVLFAAIDEIFEGLAKNAGKYAHAVSSQANESLNASITRKAPKNLTYSLTRSMDFRVGAAVAEKNEGESYLLQVFEKMDLTIDENLRQHVQRVEGRASQIADRASTVEFKGNRLELKKNRAALRHRNEGSEGLTYQSQMGLISTPVINEQPMPNNETVADLANDEFQVVFFDLETSGFSANCDILQIAAGTGSTSFEIYIKPSKPIDRKATEKNHLANVSGDLYMNGILVEAVSIRCALTELLSYLQKFNKKCILVAHNLSFDGPRLLRSIEKASLLNEFHSVVAGLACSLKAYKHKMNIQKRKEGNLKLENLARAHVKHVDTKSIHNASYDVYLLRRFVCNVFSLEDIVSELIPMTDAVTKYQRNNHVRNIIETLSVFPETIIPKTLKKKMGEANISFAELQSAFNEAGIIGIVTLLDMKIKYKPRNFNLHEIYQGIADYLKKGHK
ncbi:uncharacterized protein LOC135169826 isoform X2 [Diachasmimorpha longicaudata]|uniref:uncharacterized protein LOC135169826 isoform X2 n=1 Tax=Diachasmimorpha longicaudata TaxID=58733 RepID=UPI0030B8C3F3